MYATEQELKVAKEMGYEIERSVQRGHSFKLGNRHVWGISDGWQTADIINGLYSGHQKFDDLTSALERPTK